MPNVLLRLSNVWLNDHLAPLACSCPNVSKFLSNKGCYCFCRSREKIIKSKKSENKSDPKKRVSSSKTGERGRRSVSTDRGSNRSTKSRDSSGKGSNVQQKQEKEKRATVAKDSRSSSDRQEEEKSRERKTEGSGFKSGSFTAQKENLDQLAPSNSRDTKKQLSATTQSGISIPVTSSGVVGLGRGRGTFVQNMQGMKTGVVAIPAAFGRGTAVMKVLPKGSKFMKPADFVPRPFQMKMLDGKVRRPQPVLKCFADDEDNIEKPQEKTPGSTSRGENQPVVPAAVENIFPEEPADKMPSSIDNTQSSGYENSDVASSNKEDTKHSRVVLPPSRKRKAQDQTEGNNVEKKTIQEKTSKQQGESPQETYGPHTAQQAKQSDFKRARNSEQEAYKIEEIRKDLRKPEKQGELVEEENRSAKRIVVQKESRSSSRGQREKEKEREKRKEKPKQNKEESTEKDSKRDERGRDRRIEKSVKDQRMDSANTGSSSKRREPSPGFYFNLHIFQVSA